MSENINKDETRDKESNTSEVHKKEDVCEDFLKGKCEYGNKCDKKHKRNQFYTLLKEINVNLQEIYNNENIKYYLRKRKKPEKNDEEEKSDKDEKRNGFKDKMKKRKERKAKNNIKTDKSSKDKKVKASKDKKVKAPKEKKEKVPKEKKAKKEKKFTIMTNKTKIIDEDCEDFLNTECKKVFCDKIHNYTLKFKDCNNEEFARRYYTVNQDFSVLEPYQRKLYGNACLDLMFLVDCTGSMSTWINAVKNELKTVITFIKDNNPYATIRISFVGYRDFDCDQTNRYVTMDFTEDVELAKDFISKVNATGGADTPEDIAGGLKKGLEQTWRETSAKYCILICDAPCHGEKYHNFDDAYPKGCPNGLIPEDLIQEYATKQITFYAVKIKNYTDQMFKIFSDKYQEITKQPIVIAELGQSTEKLAFLVAVGANNTLSSMTVNNIPLREFLNALKKEATVSVDDLSLNDEYKTKLNNFVNRVNTLVVEQEEEEKKTEKINTGMVVNEEGCTTFNNMPKEIVLKITNEKNPNFNHLLNSKTVNSICHSFYVKKDRYTNINWKNPFIQNSNVKSNVTISNDPFSEGCNRYAFYMKDNDLNQNLVAKVPKIMKTYTIEELSKELEQITICQYIVNDFNDRIVNLVPDTRLLLNFIDCYIYQILDEDHPYQFYTAENYIKGEYVKYNNNAGWISSNVTDQTLIAQAFSHFSWQITKGYLTVVDLQGVGGFLTDPQIHCVNQKKYGNGNFGYVGIMKFFMSHNCNTYCRKLELIHPRNFINIDKDYKFFVDKYVPPDNHSKIYKLCDLCKVPYQALGIDLYNLKKKCWDALCPDCENKRKNSFKGATCTVCKGFFKSAAFIYKMKRIPFPDKCMKCRQEDVNKQRDDFYKDNNEQEDVEMI